MKDYKFIFLNFQLNRILLLNNKMKPPSKVDYLIISLLIVLAFLPLTAGAFRLVQLTTSADINSESTRFFVMPLPIVLHVLSSALFSVFGAFQFAPNFRVHNLSLHRINGRLVMISGFVVGLTGLLMTMLYKAPVSTDLIASFDGPTLQAIRLLVSFLLILFLSLGIVAAMNGDYLAHQAWMMRSFALGLGAGTQVFTHIPWFLFPSMHSEFARVVFMALGWLINIYVAEYLISRKHF